MKKLMLLSLLALGPAAAQADETAAVLRGAGSTLAAPLMRVWAEDYHRFRLGSVAAKGPGTGDKDPVSRPSLGYEAVGSSAGLEKLKAGQKDFAVSERPLSSSELRKAGLRQIPVAVSGLAIVTNVPGAPKLKLTGSVLADIYLGKVKNWNDAAISKLNPGVKLPAQAIRPVYRSDGSGSTYALSGYLSAVSATWKKSLGQDTSLQWPVGIGVRGSEGVRDTVTLMPYTIGYISDVQARRAMMNVASLVNASGQATLPSSASLTAATLKTAWRPGSDFVESLLNAPGKDSYPLVTAIYFLYPDKTKADANRRSVAFAQWAVKQGEMQARKLGYLPLPAAKVKLIETYLKQ